MFAFFLLVLCGWGCVVAAKQVSDQGTSGQFCRCLEVFGACCVCSRAEFLFAAEMAEYQWGECGGVTTGGAQRDEGSGERKDLSQKMDVRALVVLDVSV